MLIPEAPCTSLTTIGTGSRQVPPSQVGGVPCSWDAWLEPGLPATTLLVSHGPTTLTACPHGRLDLRGRVSGGQMGGSLLFLFSLAKTQAAPK